MNTFCSSEILEFVRFNNQTVNVADVLVMFWKQLLSLRNIRNVIIQLSEDSWLIQ